jgi:hypothetical protein
VEQSATNPIPTIPTSPDEVAVWWLGQRELQQLVRDGDCTASLWRRLGVPSYIGEELRDAYGRAGRGRLWVPDGITLDGIDWSDSHPNAARAIEAAGIVFWRKDVATLKGRPGFLTDASLETIWEPIPCRCCGEPVDLPYHGAECADDDPRVLRSQSGS